MPAVEVKEPSSARYGFSLVELLMALIVISLLAGIVGAVIAPSRSRTETARLISDLKTLTRAAQLAHADRHVWPVTIGELGPYLDGRLCETDRVCYRLARLGNDLYIRGNLGFKIGSSVRERIAEVAAHYGIYEYDGETMVPYRKDDSLFYHLGRHAGPAVVSSRYLLNTDFEATEDLAFFRNLFPNSEHWILREGNLITPERGASQRYAFGDANWRNYRITADVTLESGNGYGIYYRADGQRDITGYVFQYDPGLGDRFVVRKVVEGREQRPFQSVSMSESMGDSFQVKGTSHEVDIAVVGDRHVINVDGRVVLNFTDGDFSVGGGGLRKWGRGVTIFEELRVEEL